jgi:succinate dehydrogenase/fumarate reductase flavoprotein subunit
MVNMSLENVVETDVLVIGGGIAGCFAAIKARDQGLDVTIVDKAYASKAGGTVLAMGGYMVFNPEWGFDLEACMNALNKRGEYINDREWSEIILKDSLATYHDLVSWGSKFGGEDDKVGEVDRSGKFSPFGVFTFLRRFKDIPDPLRNHSSEIGVRIIDRVMVTDLLKQDGKVVGAIGLPMTGDYDSYIFKAKATVISTGMNSFKPGGWQMSVLTGDGEAMAYRAGAEITGKEFPSTNPTYASYPDWRHNRLEAVFPERIDAEGNKFVLGLGMGRESDLSIEFLVHAGKGPLFWNLDAATTEDIERMRKLQRKFGIDTDKLEGISLDISKGGKIAFSGGGSAGAQNSQATGIWPVNKKCATSLPGLYVAGESCGTRCVGAFHPVQGFGLTGAAVTGYRAGMGSAEYAMQAEKPIIDDEELARFKKNMYSPIERKGGFSPRWVTQVLQGIMIPYFILHIKHGKRLQAALTIVEFLRDHLVPKLVAKDNHELRLAHETKNMVLNAEMILGSSLFRTESRGVHYREDYPRRDDPNWLAWVKLKEDQGSMKFSKVPIPKEWWPDLSKPYEERYPERFPGE